MSWGKVLVVLLCFSVELRLKASPLFESPQGCLSTKDKKLCTLSNKSEKSVGLKLSQALVHLSKDSLLLINNGELELVKGDFKVKARKVLSIRTEFGVLELAPKDILIIQKKQNHQLVYILEGSPVYKGANKNMKLTEAFRYEMAGVDRSGAQDIKLPQLSDKEHLLSVWSSLEDVKLESFKVEYAKYQEKWDQGFKSITVAYKQEAQREVASFNKQAKIQQAKQAKEDKEDQELDRLFKTRYFLNQ